MLQGEQDESEAAILYLFIETCSVCKNELCPGHVMKRLALYTKMSIRPGHLMDLSLILVSVRNTLKL